MDFTTFIRRSQDSWFEDFRKIWTLKNEIKFLSNILVFNRIKIDPENLSVWLWWSCNMWHPLSLSASSSSWNFNQIHVKLVIGPFKSFSVTTSNLSWIFQDSRIIHIYSALNISTVTTIAWFRPRPLLQQPDHPLNHSDSHHNHVSKLIICRSIRYHHNSIFVKCFWKYLKIQFI